MEEQFNPDGAQLGGSSQEAASVLGTLLTMEIFEVGQGDPDGRDIHTLWGSLPPRLQTCSFLCLDVFLHLTALAHAYCSDIICSRTPRVGKDLLSVFPRHPVLSSFLYLSHWAVFDWLSPCLTHLLSAPYSAWGTAQPVERIDG